MSSSQRILIVDDQALIRSILRLMLTKLGETNVAEATNGVEAARITQETSPDLIFCDIRMAPMDGMEFLRNLRSGLYGAANTPLIFLTSSVDADIVNSAAELRATDYLIKPVTEDGLKNALAAASQWKTYTPSV